MLKVGLKCEKIEENLIKMYEKCKKLVENVPKKTLEIDRMRGKPDKNGCKTQKMYHKSRNIF